MGADRDDAPLEELLSLSLRARVFYASALKEREQVLLNTYGSLPPLRDFGDAALLGRAFPPPSARLWAHRLSHPIPPKVEGTAALFASKDPIGKRLEQLSEKARTYNVRVLRAIDATRKLDQTIESIRSAWIARQASNEAAPTQAERDRDARVARAFQDAVRGEAGQSEALEVLATRFGHDDASQPLRRNDAGPPTLRTFLEKELRREFRAQRDELHKAAAWLQREWTRRHARNLDTLHRGEVGPTANLPVMEYTSLPNPWDWSAKTLREMHRQCVSSVSEERYMLEAVVRKLSAAHASHELSQLCTIVQHVALRQHELDGIAQSTDDWAEAAQHETVALRPLREAYTHALEKMIERAPRWTSAWESRTYPYLLTREDVEERVDSEILQPLSSEARAQAVRETERAAAERDVLEVRLDILIEKDGIEIALADALANRCAEALLVRELRDRTPGWPGSTQELVNAVDDMLMQPTWRERNHRGTSGADEAMDRIYAWVLRSGDHHHNRHWFRVPSTRPSVSCGDDENVNDLNRPLLPCTITTNPETDTFSTAGMRKELPTLSVAAAAAYRRRLLR